MREPAIVFKEKWKEFNYNLRNILQNDIARLNFTSA